jgi:hypothetical protein
VASPALEFLGWKWLPYFIQYVKDSVYRIDNIRLVTLNELVRPILLVVVIPEHGNDWRRSIGKLGRECHAICKQLALVTGERLSS